MEKKNRKRKQGLRKADYDRKWLVKELSERANFYRKDVDFLLDCFVDILAEIIGNRKILNISGLFKMYLSERKAGTFFNASSEQFEETGKSYYASFKASRKLLRHLPEMQDKFPAIENEE